LEVEVKNKNKLGQKQRNLVRLAQFFYEVGTMRKMARIHRQVLFTDDMSDNIATHSFRAAFIGFMLAKMAGANPFKVMAMCLLHDMGEARTNDHNWIHKRYVKSDDTLVLEEQLGALPFDDLAELAREYERRESLEALLAKDADVLDQVLLLREYEHQGNKEAPRWLRGKRRKGLYHQKYCTTVWGKKLGDAICAEDPADWWSQVYTNKRRK